MPEKRSRKFPSTCPTSQLALAEWFVFPLVVYGPTVEPEYDGAFMSKTPEQYYGDDVPWITGLNQNELVWLVSAIIQGLILFIHVTDINTRWENIGLIFMALDYNSTEVNTEKINQIWDFYMGDQKFSWATRQFFLQRYLTECSLEAVRYHSMYTNQSGYTYHFTYQGRFSNVQQFGGKPEDWGVSHLDDLIYPMKNPDYYQTLQLGDPELEMSYIFTKVWEQFATHGIPYLPGEENVGGNGGHVGANSTIWQPIEKATDRFSALRFLELNLETKMVDDPFVDRYNFWRLEIDPNP